MLSDLLWGNQSFSTGGKGQESCRGKYLAMNRFAQWIVMHKYWISNYNIFLKDNQSKTSSTLNLIQRSREWSIQIPNTILDWEYQPHPYNFYVFFKQLPQCHYIRCFHGNICNSAKELRLQVGIGKWKQWHHDCPVFGWERSLSAERVEAKGLHTR